MLRMLKNAKLSVMVLSFLEYKTNLIIFIVTKMIMSWNMLSSHLKAKEDVVSLFSDAVYEPKAMWGNIFVFFSKQILQTYFAALDYHGKISPLKQAQVSVRWLVLLGCSLCNS